MQYYYFGLTLPTGHTNQEYSDVIEAIHSYIDDVIFFSSLLCDDLIEYGNKLRSRERYLETNAPKVNEVNFSTPIASKLIPPKSNYLDVTVHFPHRFSS